MSKIANYDTLDYDYSTYWKKREYENRAEHNVLENVFSTKQGNWFIDIGGSFGRLTDTYSKNFSKPLIIDYSLKTLQKNRSELLKRYPELELVAANAYKLPFANDTFDGGLMVRVLHHIDKPEDYFKEIERVLNGDATYLQEFANKIHIKARIRGILKADFSIFNKDPYQQPDKNNHEGARENADVPFLNFHPKWIREQLNRGDLEVVRKLGASYFRIPFLKKLLGTKTLDSLERLAQKTLSWTNIPPSIFYEVTKRSHVKRVSGMTLDSILVCPSCHGSLNFNKDIAKCTECKKTYRKEKSIWDFRI